MVVGVQVRGGIRRRKLFVGAPSFLKLRRKPASAVKGSVRGSVRESVKGSVRESVKGSVREIVREIVREEGAVGFPHLGVILSHEEDPLHLPPQQSTGGDTTRVIEMIAWKSGRIRRRG